MSGLKKRNDNVQYVNLKDGKFYLSTDKEKTDAYDEVGGMITNMSFRDDEYEGTPIRKFNITVFDGETDYVVSMKTDSSYFSSLVGFLKNADITKPLELVPSMKVDKEGKKSINIFVRQNGKYMKAYYTKDNPHGLPPFEKLGMKNGKPVWSKDNYLAFLEGVVTTELKPQIGDTIKSETTTTGLTKGDDAQSNYSQEVPVIHDGEEVQDDLPF